MSELSQFTGAQMIAGKFGFSCDMLGRFALESHARATVATEARAFAREIVAVAIGAPDGPSEHVIDEGIAAAKLLQDGGVISAANASQVCDGASGVLAVSQAAPKTHGLTPLARIHNLTVTAGVPVIMLEVPIPATKRALQRAGMSIGDIDLYEVSEAFAPGPLAWQRELDADPARLNVNGGAFALGHPLSASGANLMATLVHALRARGLRYGLPTMCEGDDIANVTIVEAL